MEALHAGYHVILFTRMDLVPNYRIGFIFTRRITEFTDVNHEYSFFCPELSNFFSHGESRRVSVLLSRDLSFGPTDQREVIIEFANWFRHTEHRGESRFYCPELSNLRIGFVTRKVTEYHGWFLSRDLFFGSTDQREVICELVFFTRKSTDGRGGYEGGTIEA